MPKLPRIRRPKDRAPQNTAPGDKGPEDKTPGDKGFEGVVGGSDEADLDLGSEPGPTGDSEAAQVEEPTISEPTTSEPTTTKAQHFAPRSGRQGGGKLALTRHAKRSRVRPNWRLHLTIVMAFAVFIVALVDASPMRGTGDAGEYYMMADKIGHLHKPVLYQQDMQHYSEQFAAIGGYMGFGVAYTPGDPGPWQMNHFWSYSAVVAPVLRVTDALDMNPVRAFTLANTLLLLVAMWVVLRKMHWWPTVLLFAGPVIWWSDKIHSEVFTFSLLAMAFALVRDKPVWSMLLIGAAATQNFPIGMTVPLVALYALWHDHGLLKAPRFYFGLIVSGLLSAASPIYYQITIGTSSPQSFNGGVDPRVPSLKEFTAPLFDLNVGVGFAAPVLMLVAIGALAVLVIKFRKTDWPLVGVFVISLLWFLFSFAQTGNFNHGATPGMTRYGMWIMGLFPLVFMEAQRVLRRRAPQSAAVVDPDVETTPVVPRPGQLPAGLAIIGIGLLAISMVTSIVGYHPKISDGLHRRSPIASWVWSNHPSWNNPLPEIFWERNQPKFEGNALSVANQDCHKVLVVRGEWPASCDSIPTPQVPADCIPPRGSACYANRQGDGGWGWIVVKGVPGVDMTAVEVGDLSARLRQDGVTK